MFFSKSRFLESAYTMSEFLISIAIIGAIASMTIPVFITHNTNKKETEMHNKASYLIEQIASEMIENETMYPRTSDISKQGFQNTDKVSVLGKTYGGGADNSTERKEKFCRLFALQINKTSEYAKYTYCPDNIDSGSKSFRSADGMDWWIPKTTFREDSNGQTKGYVKIKVDVNGKGRGQDCSAQANNAGSCTRPDTYYYYIKMNGSVTLSNPIAVNDDNYSINVKYTIKDADGKVIAQTSTGGNVVKIAAIDSNGNYGVFGTGFTNLQANKSYMLQAQPGTGYVSNWGTKTTTVEAEKHYGYKKVRTTKPINDVSVEFTKIPTYCMKVKVNCDSISTCLNSKLYKYQCSYKKVASKQGDYERPSEYLDNYEYVGPYKGNYKYECDKSAALTVSGTYLQACNLQTGDYQFYLTPAAGYELSPAIQDYYQQNVRLGNCDLDNFEVDIVKKE